MYSTLGVDISALLDQQSRMGDSFLGGLRYPLGGPSLTFPGIDGVIGTS